MTGWRPYAVAAVVLLLAAVLGPHLAAVLLLAAVTAVCGSLAVLLFAIAGVVAESGWRTVPSCPARSTWKAA